MMLPQSFNVLLNAQTNSESSEIANKECVEEPASPVSVHLPTSSLPTFSNVHSAMVKQECYESAEDSSDSNSEIFCTPSTSPTPTDLNEVSYH